MRDRRTTAISAIVVIALAAAPLAWPRALAAFVAWRSGKEAATHQVIVEWGHAVERYRAARGAWPSRLRQARLGWPTDDYDLPPAVDAWGRPLRYTARADGFDLRSAGLDGLFGTPDDVGVESGSAR